ncbi:MAG: NAD(P)H-dependent oxidoreductase [Myxococcota bacterium]
MKLLAYAATYHSTSINKALVTYAASLVPNAQVDLLDLNDFTLPLYTQDVEARDGIPEAAQRFYDAIGAADAVVVSFAEHNGSYTAAYKNLYDWASRIDSKVFQGKPVVIMATSPGPRGGKGVLGAAETSMPYFGAELKGSLSVPRFQNVFDRDAGRLTDDELDGQLRALMTGLSA